MDAAKVQLSKEERTLVMNPGWILTKNSIMGKVGALFAELSEQLQNSYKRQAISFEQAINKAGSQRSPNGLQPGTNSFPPGAGSLSLETGGLPPETDRLQLSANRLPLNWSTPKISKGENYRGLPWVVLDYPRAFGREDVLAIRTLFWWGHYFSVTLHLKGRYKDLYLPVIRERIALLAEAGFHISVSDDEWRHELDSDNYLPLQEDMDTMILKERAFLKLSAKCGLDRWDDAGSVLLELFRVLAGVLSQAASH